MSIDIEVFGVRIPKNLGSKWERAFADCGMLCEFRPDFDAKTWSGGDLAAKIQVLPDAFPDARLYGDRPFVAGCGMDMYHAPVFDEERDYLLGRCAAAFRSRLKKAIIMCVFTTSMGRGPEAWRFQIFAAATLAKVTDGLLYDPQGAKFYSSDEAVKLAEREAESGDKEAAKRLRKGKLLNVRRFRSWPIALKDAIPEFEVE